ncbi:MAG: YqhA family protein [Candidatus Promineifilaceae bacterium]
MSRFFVATRYLIIIPIIGLGIAAATFFVFGGISLLRVIFEAIAEVLGIIEVEAHADDLPIMVEVVEYVHTFLIGTVLYITSIGFYQLFIGEIEFPGWLQIHNTEELETSLIGVTVVVLAVNFLSVVFTGENVDLIAQGAGIALPIAALGIFVGLRAWASRQEHDRLEPSNSKNHEETEG